MNAPALAATTRQAVVDAMTDLHELYACTVCYAEEPCEHTPPLGVEASEDACRLLAALTDVLPLLSDDAVALVADRLLGGSDD